MIYMTLNVSKARSEAKKLAERYPSLPIDVYAIARDNGIEIVEGIFNRKDVAAVLHHDPEEKSYLIAINKDCSSERQRFSIGHELGHYFLHAKKNLETKPSPAEPIMATTFFRDSKSSTAEDRLEVEANQFAAELLMPSADVSEQAEIMKLEGQDYLDIVGKLASRYDVSTTAMGIKLGVMTQF